MVYPPTPIDPTKDLWTEVVRFSIEQRRYLLALKDLANYYGPWPEEETLLTQLAPKPREKKYATISRMEDDPCEHYYWDRMIKDDGVFP